MLIEIGKVRGLTLIIQNSEQLFTLFPLTAE